MFKLILALLLLPLNSFAKCKGLTESLPVRHAISVQKDITYCQTPTENLLLDIYRPTTQGQFPVVVFLYGGGWVSGSKNGFDSPLRQLAAKGLVGVAINYRLVKEGVQGRTQNKFPAQLSDIQCALQWLRAHGYPTNKVGIWGESAGAHLALLAGLDKSNGIKAIVNLYGPTNLPLLYQDSPNLRAVMALTFGKEMNAVEWFQGSPIHKVTKDSPPILTIHGTADPLVPYSQATELVKATSAAGSPHQLIACEGEDHGLTPESRGAAFEHSFSFFHKLLK